MFIKLYARGSEDAMDYIAQLVKENEQKTVRIDIEVNPASFM